MEDVTATAADETGQATPFEGSSLEKLTEAFDQVKESAGEYASAGGEQVDRTLKSAASTLRNTANSLRSQAASGGGKASEFAETAGDKLDISANYLGEFDSRQLFTGLQNWTRRNPVLALGGAAFVGFLLGRSLKRERG